MCPSNIGTTNTGLEAAHEMGLITLLTDLNQNPVAIAYINNIFSNKTVGKTSYTIFLQRFPF